MERKMNTMIKGTVILLMIGLFSCTKYNYIDGGLSYGVHDCTMWEYFKKQPRDWDSTRIMIEHAGLKSLFDGTGEYKQITFFGFTNFTVLRYMMDHNAELAKDDLEYWHRVTDIPEEECRAFIQKLVVPKRLMLNDVPRGKRQEVTVGEVSKYEEVDGMVCSTLGGELFLWTIRGFYGDIAEAGAVVMYIANRTASSTNHVVVSTNIQTTNGVVQALGYDFKFDNF